MGAISEPRWEERADGGVGRMVWKFGWALARGSGLRAVRVGLELFRMNLRARLGTGVIRRGLEARPRYVLLAGTFASYSASSPLPEWHRVVTVKKINI